MLATVVCPALAGYTLTSEPVAHTGLAWLSRWGLMATTAALGVWLFVDRRSPARATLATLSIGAMIAVLGHDLLSETLVAGTPTATVEGLDASRRSGWPLATADLIGAALLGAFSVTPLARGARVVPRLAAVWTGARGVERWVVSMASGAALDARADVLDALAAAALFADLTIAVWGCRQVDRWLREEVTGSNRLRLLLLAAPALALLVATSAPRHAAAGTLHRRATRTASALESVRPWPASHARGELRGSFLALTREGTLLAVSYDDRAVLRPGASWRPSPHGATHVVLADQRLRVDELQRALHRIWPTRVALGALYERRPWTPLDARLPAAGDHRAAVELYPLFRGDGPDRCFDLAHARPEDSVMAATQRAGCARGGEPARFDIGPPDVRSVPLTSEVWRPSWPTLLIVGIAVAFVSGRRRERRAKLASEVWALIPLLVGALSFFAAALLPG